MTITTYGVKYMNLPNKITLFRIAMIPLFVYVYMAQPFGAPWSDWAAIAVFTVASISDAIDGYVARTYNLITNFGKLMDPLADKLLVCAAFITFVATGMMPAWAVIVLVSREFFISGMRQLALEKGMILAASAGGKIKMVTQVVLIIFLLIPFSWWGLVDIFYWMVLIVTLLASVLSAVDYAVRNWSLFSQLG